MLTCARRLTRYDVPIVGVNVGRLGFLAGVNPSSFKREFERILDGKYRIIERMMLEVDGLEQQQLQGDSSDMVVLNELVLERGGSPRTLSIDVFHGEEYFNTFSADGVIVSTPTGSTAYSLSAGGPLVAATLEVMIISPICPHCLYERPFIIAADMPVRLQLQEFYEDALVVLDGQRVFRSSDKVNIEIRKAKNNLKMLTPTDVGQYEVIRSKLNWGCPFIPVENSVRPTPPKMDKRK